MFLHLGNIEKALDRLKNNKNNAIVKVFENNKNTSSPLVHTNFTIKDNFATKFYPTEASSKFLKGFNPFYNATILDKLEKSGAILLAKTNLDEFALGGTGTYSYNGLITNPLDKNRYVGGSSSGAAASFNEYISFAIGSDTGDSVRLPASYIGKVGFKPSYGAVSRYGLYQYSSSLDTVAWFSHNVNDSYEIAKILYGVDNKDNTSLDININDVKILKPSKVGYLDVFDYLNDNVKFEYEKTIKKLENEKIELVKISLPVNLLNSIQTIYEIISYSEASTNLANLTGIHFGKQESGTNWEDIEINSRSNSFQYMVQRRLTLGAYFLDQKNQIDFFLRAQKIRRVLKDTMDDIFSKIDLLVFPASSFEAPLFDEKIDKNKYQFMNNILTLANLVGQPSFSIPWMNNNNLPINFALETSIYKDKDLFSYALYIEKLLGDKNE